MALVEQGVVDSTRLPVALSVRAQVPDKRAITVRRATLAHEWIATGECASR